MMTHMCSLFSHICVVYFLIFVWSFKVRVLEIYLRNMFSFVRLLGVNVKSFLNAAIEGKMKQILGAKWDCQEFQSLTVFVYV